MNEAIEILMHEHRVIERVIGAMRRFVRGVERGEAAERGTIGDFAEFFRNFADRCHHGKEEDKLFADMVRNGFPQDQGPLAVMLHEHEQGREHVRALAALAAGIGPLSAEERSQLAHHADAFAALLSSHILKEDGILYPMSARVLSSSDFERLAREFEEFEEKVMGKGEHERYHALADSLIERFGTDEATRLASPCCHHS